MAKMNTMGIYSLTDAIKQLHGTRRIPSQNSKSEKQE